MDAVARQIFYDRLLEDYSEHPRTIVLSTHLIDEISNLLEHVLVIDNGRIIIDQDADSLRGSATTVVGTRTAVDAFEGLELSPVSLPQLTIQRTRLTDHENENQNPSVEKEIA